MKKKKRDGPDRFKYTSRVTFCRFGSEPKQRVIFLVFIPNAFSARVFCISLSTFVFGDTSQPHSPRCEPSDMTIINHISARCLFVYLMQGSLKDRH